MAYSPTSNAGIRAALGIDAGTTAVKVMLVGGDGAVIAEAEVEHPVSVPRPGWAEQHPAIWWRSTTLAVRKAMQSANKNNRSVERLHPCHHRLPRVAHLPSIVLTFTG